MTYRCPLCGQRNEAYRHDRSGWLTWDHQATAKTIVDIWENVPVPSAPRLELVATDPATTALLILDMETTICRSPRCLTSIASIGELLWKARQKGMPVVYSLIQNGDVADIFPQIAPLAGDPIVASSVDKFYKTNLNKILQECGVRTVIVTGYAANGTVLHTATAAAFRGYHVIVPVDGMSANNPYAEQYTAWHMLNSPGAKNRVTLTKTSLIVIGRHNQHYYE